MIINPDQLLQACRNHTPFLTKMAQQPHNLVQLVSVRITQVSTPVKRTLAKCQLKKKKKKTWKCNRNNILPFWCEPNLFQNILWLHFQANLFKGDYAFVHSKNDEAWSFWNLTKNKPNIYCNHKYFVIAYTMDPQSPRKQKGTTFSLVHFLLGLPFEKDNTGLW